jgi:hypothetical protein
MTSEDCTCLPRSADLACSVHFPAVPAPSVDQPDSLPLPSMDSPSGAAWRKWFERMGERATLDVVNATATLVVEERELASVSPVVDIEDEARALVSEWMKARGLVVGVHLSDGDIDHALVNRITTALTAQELVGYRKGIEDAAKESRDQGESCAGTWKDFTLGYKTAAEDIYAAIRSKLKE